jgi:NAD-dependent SIR2 family protein deacetylase
MRLLMPLELGSFIREVQPARTVLLFGAGASVASGAPSVQALQQHFEKVFGTPASGYTLAEQTGIIEQTTKDRRRLIEELRSQFSSLKPAGAILNLPLYRWKSIYTTNYDELVEQAYVRRGRPLKAYSANFDFTVKENRRRRNISNYTAQ